MLPFCTHPLAVLALASISAAAKAPIVSLDYGTFLGIKDGNLTKFLGVPFAQPAGRFELPKPPKPLHGLQNATTPGPACPQQKLSPLPFDPFPHYSLISESCLTLDVFTPSTPKPGSKLPVLVWLYGGGWEIGNSGDTDFRPSIEHSISIGEPVIIVAPNYRLSAFGFLAGKEASAAGTTNLGMRDQISALEWVQKHISVFGGDPKRVVLGGASAGSTSTALLLVDNKRKSSDLFRGAFMECIQQLSGSPIPVHTQADGQKYYDQLVAATNCTAARHTLDCLRGVPYETLLASVNQTPDLFSYLGMSLLWGPSIDGDIVVRNPLESVSRGAYAKIPLLSGDDDDEGTFFSIASTNVTTEDGFADYLRTVSVPRASSAQISHLATLYPQDPAQGSPFGTGSANAITPEFKRIAAFEGDFVFQAPRRFFLQHASKTQNTWSWLNKRGKATPLFGAAHTTVLPSFFGTAPSDNVALNALINFINTLDPNRSAASRQPASVFWPTYQTPSADGPTSLLTFSDPLLVNVTADTFRADAMKYISELQLAGVGL
ncbi:carotenoid ester lipase precursor [Mycena rebaudengoi]|nr:carotenoid ester lipase precursor [Mycena rebaudengoi]